MFTKVAGNHTIKFGEDFRHTRDFLLQTQDNGGPRGQFQFRATQTSIPSDAAATAGFANAFASFLLDVPSLVQRDLKVTDPGVRFWAFFTFIQDKWAVTPKLTIDLGLRHEFYTPFIGLADQGGAVELRSGDQHAAGRRLRQRQRERRRAEVPEELRPARRRVVPPERQDGAARRLRRQHAAVPGQRLRLQLPGQAEQRLQRAEQLRARRLDEDRVPRSGVRADSLQRHHRREPGGAAERELLPRAARHARRVAALVQRRVPA